MAVKQYIGARYVPLLDGAYNPDKEYEPLTSVNYGQATYTSRKKVPAGIAPTNSEYWMQTGFGSQGVADLQEWRTQTVEPFMQATNDAIASLAEFDTQTVQPFINNVSNELNILEEKVFDTPEDFGAVGDGVTDDTQAFIDMFGNSDKNVFVLKNKYLITSGIVIEKSGIQILGTNGCEVKIIRPSIPAGQDYEHTFLIRNSKNVLVNGIHFTGGERRAYSETDGYYYDAITVTNCKNVTISGCFFDALRVMRGVIFKESELCIFKDNITEYYRYIGVAFINNCKMGLVQNSVFRDVGFNYVNTYAIGLSSQDHNLDNYMPYVCEDMYCIGNLIEYPNTTANWESIDCHGVYRAFVLNNTILDCRNGIAMGSDYSKNFKTVVAKISGNYIRGKVGNDFETSYGIGVGGDQITVDGNILELCGGQTQNTASWGSNCSILCMDGLSNSTISNNTIRAGYGVAIYFAGTGDNPDGYYLVNIFENVIGHHEKPASVQDNYSMMTYFASSAKVTALIVFEKNLIRPESAYIVFSSPFLVSGLTAKLLIRDNEFTFNNVAYINYDNVITDWCTSPWHATLSNGMAGLIRKIYNATDGSSALKFYNGSTWLDIA